jgi:hypothetical protein
MVPTKKGEAGKTISLPKDQIKLSDVLSWLYNELKHIRRIHFWLVTLSAITIIIALEARSNKIYLEIRELSNIAKNFHQEICLRQLFEDEINALEVKIPQFNFILKPGSTEKLIRFIPGSVTEMEDLSLERIRENLEGEVKIEIIKDVEFSEAEISQYIEWKSKMNDYHISSKSDIQWPLKENKNGKINFIIEAGAFFEDKKWNGGGPHRYRYVSFGKYSAIGTFNYKTITLKKSNLWFSQNFPYLSKNWTDYKNRTLISALEEAKDKLMGELPQMTLPFGIKITHDKTLMILPGLLLVYSFILMIEVLHVCAYARYCQKYWQSSPILISPWIGGRDWVFKWPLLILVTIFLPVFSICLLFKNFPIFGYPSSIYIVLLFTIFYLIFVFSALVRLVDITRFSFPINNHEKNELK